MLDECLEFLEGRSSSYEVIIVDDGSKDATTQVGLGYVEKYGCDKVRGFVKYDYLISLKQKSDLRHLEIGFVKCT
jgi:glycosyltransferase involved in cell wall biosynthesis